MLLESIVSTAGGLLAGVVPAGIGLLKSHFAAKQELKLLSAQTEMQLKLGTQRLDEVQMTADANALTAAYQHDTAGIDRAPPWAVAVRVLQRPLLSWAAVGIFIWAAAYCLLAGLTEPIDIFNRAAHFANIVMVFYFTDRGIRKYNGEK